MPTSGRYGVRVAGGEQPGARRFTLSVASSATKTVVKNSAGRVGSRFGWREVLGAVQDSAARSGLVGSLRDAGFTADDFASVNKARDIVCTWLSRYEDSLEGVQGRLRAEERARVRAVRRRLELELFP